MSTLHSQKNHRIIGLTIRAKIIGGGDPFKVTMWSEIADFLSIFACRASAVTPSEKGPINTNKKSTVRFLMSPR